MCQGTTRILRQGGASRSIPSERLSLAISDQIRAFRDRDDEESRILETDLFDGHRKLGTRVPVDTVPQEPRVYRRTHERRSARGLVIDSENDSSALCVRKADNGVNQLLDQPRTGVTGSSRSDDRLRVPLEVKSR